MEQMTYESAGVRRDLGDEASRIMYEAARETWKNRRGQFGEVLVPLDDFSGLRAVDVSNLPAGTLLNLGFDGVGTKVELAERMDRHDTIAHDLFAMVCDDAVIRGAEPVLLGSILDINALADAKGDFLGRVKALAKGYVDAANAAGVAVVNGEIAELGLRIHGFGPFNYSWGAAVLWFARKERLLTGKQVQVGDAIIGLREEGFRSNGLSLLRKVLETAHGDRWHTQPFEDATMGAVALRPSVIYTRLVNAITGGFTGTPAAPLHGAAHITGGGIPGKLGRLLRASGFGAELSALFPPSPLMKTCQTLGSIPDREAYSTWNMGQGMLLITPAPTEVLAIAATYGIEAQQVGEISATPGIHLRSQGALSPGQRLSFDPTRSP